MKFDIEINADQIDWKELTAKINDAIEEETTKLTSVRMSRQEGDETD
jgi:hypothetical protein